MEQVIFSSSEDPRQKKHVLGHVLSATQHIHSHIVLLWMSKTSVYRVWCLWLNILSLAGGPPRQSCYASITCSLTLSTPRHIYLCRGCRITPAYQVSCLWPNIISLARRAPCQKCCASGTCSVTPITFRHKASCSGCQITSVYRAWRLWLNILSDAGGSPCQKCDASGTCSRHQSPT